MQRPRAAAGIPQCEPEETSSSGVCLLKARSGGFKLRGLLSRAWEMHETCQEKAHQLFGTSVRSTGTRMNLDQAHAVAQIKMKLLPACVDHRDLEKQKQSTNY